MGKKAIIPKTLRLRVFARDNYTCRYCGKEIKHPHADHVYPESKGGITSFENLVTACPACNRKKHNRIGLWPLPLVTPPNKIKKPKKPKKPIKPSPQLQIEKWALAFIAVFILINVTLYFFFNLTPGAKIYITVFDLLAGSILYVWRNASKDR